jgi:hypothetical protein
MSVPLRADDPAAWMLSNGMAEQWAIATGQIRAEDAKWITPTHDDIYRESCYICRDPEFALMGLPVCKPCVKCGGHLAADDEVCENGHNNNPHCEEEDF